MLGSIVRPLENGRHRRLDEAGPPEVIRFRAPALPAQSAFWWGGTEERAVRRATTVGKGAKPPSEYLCDFDRVAAEALGEVERAVGGGHQLVAAQHVVREGGDANAHRERPVAEPVALDDVPDALSVLQGAALRRVDQQHRELVAAVAGDDREAPRVAHDDLRHFFE